METLEEIPWLLYRKSFEFVTVELYSKIQGERSKIRGEGARSSYLDSIWQPVQNYFRELLSHTVRSIIRDKIRDKIRSEWSGGGGSLIDETSSKMRPSSIWHETKFNRRWSQSGGRISQGTYSPVSSAQGYCHGNECHSRFCPSSQNLRTCVGVPNPRA